MQVITVAPGLSPNEVENLVSYPMETAMMGLPRTQGVRSISKAGISVVTVSYDDDVDMYFARAQVQQRMQDAVGSLPTGCGRRSVRRRRRWARCFSTSSSRTRCR